MYSTEILDKVQNYTKNKVVNIKELKLIIENSTEKEFEKIIFTAKFLKGMLNILMGNKASKSEKMKLMPEYTNNIAELTKNMKLVFSKNEAGKGYFEDYFQEKFFALNRNSMQNFVILITDLSLCKDYFNDHNNL